jgi:hypothetical protein
VSPVATPGVIAALDLAPGATSRPGSTGEIPTLVPARGGAERAGAQRAVQRLQVAKIAPFRCPIERLVRGASSRASERPPYAHRSRRHALSCEIARAPVRSSDSLGAVISLARAARATVEKST